MKVFYMMFGFGFIGLAIFGLMGYVPSKSAIFFGYLTCACLWFGKGLEGDAK